MITGSLNRCLLMFAFINSLNTFAQEIPPTPPEINIPLDQFVNMPLEPLDGFRRMFVWPSLSDRKIDLFFHENPPYVGTPTDIPMIPDEIRFYGGYFSFSAYSARQIFVSVTLKVPATRPDGYPNNPGSYLDCMNSYGGHQYVYDGETVLLTGSSQVACIGRNNYYSFVKVNKLTIIPFATKPDIYLGNIEIPEVKRNPIDGLPILNVGKEITINVPISLFGGNFLLPSELVNFIPVTLNVGSQSYTKNISVSELNSIQTKVIPFNVIMNSEDVGKKKISVAANMNVAVGEDNFTNNQTFQDVHVQSGDLKLQVVALGIMGSNPCMINGPLDPKRCQSGNINDGDSLNVPFGSNLKITLTDSENEIIPANYELQSDSLVFESPIEENSLFPDQLAVLFEQDSENNSQDLISVHLGGQQIKIIPLDTSISPITITLYSKSSITIGDKKTDYDDLIISRAHKIGIPPQFIKGQVEKESGSKFDASAYRYEPSTFDMNRIQPKILQTSSSYSFKTTEVLSKRRYEKFLFRTNSRYSDNDNLIDLRSKYNVVYQGAIKSIPLNYESNLRLNQYVPLRINDIFYANPTENWPAFKSNSDGKIAQTIIASSYGLLQIMYTTAVENGRFVEAGKKPSGKDPMLLLNPEINLQYGGNYLVDCIKLVNAKQNTQLNPTNNVNAFVAYIQLGFAGYNAGPDHQDSNDPNFNSTYSKSVLNYVLKYQIYLKDEIL